ncbi:MAG TPA: HD domain-containing phosphohydrolase, partial [Nitrospira sp.]|nr:HD domain-containing phosphohydrolase [Nitrospira sp.]
DTIQTGADDTTNLIDPRHHRAMTLLLDRPTRQALLDLKRVLIIDDEEPIRRLLGYMLQSHGYETVLAADAREARLRLDETPFALVLCDVNMPGESGMDLVRNIFRQHPHTAAIMVTGLDSPLLANAALEMGAFGYIVKPFESNEVLINVANALRRRRLEMENRLHRENLEDVVRTRTMALQQALEWLERSEKELRLSREETIQRLAIAAEYRDSATAQHIQRMSHYCELLARRYGLSTERCDLIRTASPMHDIGKIGTPDHVLLKPGKFTQDEFNVIAQHAEIGYRILAGSDAEILNVAATIALTHHERWDGSGYPRKLKGEAIPIEGRIASVADAFDALTTARVYKPAFAFDHAVDLMSKHRGEHFDPELLDVFLASLGDIKRIHEQYADRLTPGLPRQI